MRSAKDIFSLIAQEIKRRTQKPSEIKPTYGVAVTTTEGSNLTTVNKVYELINNQQEVINNIIKVIQKTKNQIISGGNVVAEEPPSEYVLVYPVEAFCQGQIYKSEQIVRIKVIDPDFTIDKPGAWYICLDSNGLISLEKSCPSDKVAVAKVVLPYKETLKIRNDKTEGTYDGYIILRKDLLFEEDFVIDDETLMELKTILDKLMAENIFGTLKLSENLKITNSDGSLEMNSKSITIKYPSGNIGLYIDKDGMKIYDDSKRLLAYFTRYEAKIGNIVITPTSIESSNYKSGESGFRIQNTGDVEFDNGTFRGVIKALSGNIAGILIDSDGITGAEWPTRGFKLKNTGEIYSRDTSGAELRIKPAGLFSYNKNFTLTNLPGACQVIEYLKLYDGATITDNLIDSACYVYGNISGVVIKKLEYANDPTFPDTVNTEHKILGEDTVYYETHTFNWSEMATELIKPNGLVDGQFIQNLTASQITVGKLRSFDGNTYFDLNAGKLNIESTDTDENNKIFIGDPNSNQYLKYNKLTGRLTVRSTDYVRNVLDFDSVQAAVDDLPNTGGIVYFPAGEHEVRNVVINKDNVTFMGNGRHSVLKMELANDYDFGLEVNGNYFTLKDCVVYYSYNTDIQNTNAIKIQKDYAVMSNNIFRAYITAFPYGALLNIASNYNIIDSNIFQVNSTSYYFDHIYVWEGCSNLVITNNLDLSTSSIVSFIDLYNNSFCINNYFPEIPLIIYGDNNIVIGNHLKAINISRVSYPVRRNIVANNTTKQIAVSGYSFNIDSNIVIPGNDYDYAITGYPAGIYSGIIHDNILGKGAIGWVDPNVTGACLYLYNNVCLTEDYI